MTPAQGYDTQPSDAAVTYLLCLDSVRAWDQLAGCTRWVGGLAQPTEREGTGWHKYTLISDPVTGQEQHITWRLERQPDGTAMARGTRTSTFVVELPVDPTKGPWTFEQLDGAKFGGALLVTDPQTGYWAQAVTAMGGWLLYCYLNAVLIWDTTPAPTPMFDAADTPDPGLGAIIAADYPVALAPADQVDWFVDTLRQLPQNIVLPMALRGATAGHGWDPPRPVATLEVSDMIRVLVSCGLTDTEIETLVACGEEAMRTTLTIATSYESEGHPWTEIGTWLRAPRSGGSRLDQIKTKFGPA